MESAGEKSPTTPRPSETHAARDVMMTPLTEESARASRAPAHGAGAPVMRGAARVRRPSPSDRVPPLFPPPPRRAAPELLGRRMRHMSGRRSSAARSRRTPLFGRGAVGAHRSVRARAPRPASAHTARARRARPPLGAAAPRRSISLIFLRWRPGSCLVRCWRGAGRSMCFGFRIAKRTPTRPASVAGGVQVHFILLCRREADRAC